MLMKIINFFRNKYHLCRLCNGDGCLLSTNKDKNLSCNMGFYKKFFSDCNGYIYTKCPACKGKGIVFVEDF